MCKIICVTQKTAVSGDFLSRIDLLCSAGIDRIILREKSLSESEYLELAKDVMKICQKHQIPLSLHTFFEAAKELGSKQIHLSYKDFLLGKGSGFEFTGVSVHSLEEAVNAQKSGADYITAGHIFQTDCKKNLSPRGLDFLSEICKNVSIPVYAIGGITPENVKSIAEHGASGICVMSSPMKADNPEALISRLRNSFVDNK